MDKSILIFYLIGFLVLMLYGLDILITRSAYLGRNRSLHITGVASIIWGISVLFAGLMFGLSFLLVLSGTSKLNLFNILTVETYKVAPFSFVIMFIGYEISFIIQRIFYSKED